MSLLRIVLVCAFVLPVMARATPASGFDAAVMDSVVSVLPAWPDTTVTEGRPKDPEGSGVAIFDGGYIVTADHVIGRATDIAVRLRDGRRLAATVIGRDPPSDVALLKIAGDLPVPRIETNPSLGARVCAVGNPFGLGLSVSCGVISAVHRTGTGFNPFEDFVQTDAAINPGGSGGGLFLENGSLVGMNAAIFTNEGDGDIGVNFAASAALVVRVAEDLRDFGRVRRARSGLTVGDLGPEQAGQTHGVRVSRVRDGSAAAQAGVLVGDVLTHIESRPVFAPTDVTGAVFLKRPGESVALDLIRDGHRVAAVVTLE